MKKTEKMTGCKERRVERRMTGRIMGRRGGALLLAAAIALTAAGCGAKQGGDTKSEAAQTAETKAAESQSAEAKDPQSQGRDIKVGVIQMIDNGAFSDMREGFTERLTEGYTDGNVEIIYKNAQGDASTLNTICQEMADSGVDLVGTIATPGTQAMVNLDSGIPVFFVAVSNPTGAGVITDMEKPDKNATGTSNAIPVEDIFALCDKLTPDCKTFGVLYNTSEINAVTTAKNAKEYLESKGLTCVEGVVTNSSEVQQAAQSLAEEVDAIFVPNDSMVQSAMPMVAEVAREAKIPVYGSSAVMVTSGAFATIAVSDKEIGAKSADMALSYLAGTPIEEIPAIVVPASDMVINQKTAEALGITFTDEIKADAVFVEDAQ
ncbi:MAG: ABC transporter substrate-binding protein [Clostridiaceae bacterium]|nr:ABC transporter substrate-binding protein [Clostridiaceae bacterium]